jgi:hypothetical protein
LAIGETFISPIKKFRGEAFVFHSLKGLYPQLLREKHLKSSSPKKMVEREGFEPSKAKAARFTVWSLWPLGNLS